MTELRTETLFVECLGESVNALVGHPQSGFVYGGLKRKMGNALLAAGVNLLDPFTKPVMIAFLPKVPKPKRGGKVPKAFDCLNFAISAKIIEDWLVKFGKIKDDRREYVKGAFCAAAEIVDGDPGILVVIREVEGETIGWQEGFSFSEKAAF